MFKIYKFAFALLIINSITYSHLWACDLCSIYSSIESLEPTPGRWHFGIAEQFTAYDRVQNDGHKVANDEHQHLESSITQFVLAYDVSSQLSAQISLPYITRRFKRVEGEEIQQGTESGVGDLSLIAKFVPVRIHEQEQSFMLQLMSGIKLPTGNTDRLKEELSEDHHHHEESSVESEESSDSMPLEHLMLRHGDSEIPSAVHGHDLALGSGSVDFPIGLAALGQLDRMFFMADAQYVIRTHGDHYYSYSNDLTWSTGPGFYISPGHKFSVAAKINLSGEYKGKDKGKDHQRQNDTAINSVFLGPEIIVTSRSGIGSELALDFPLNVQNSSFQAVPSYRIRAALNYQF